MADCRVKNTRHAAIYDTIRALVRDDPNINSLKGVIDWFGKNYPNIERAEIIDSLVLPSDKNVDASKKALNRKMSGLRSTAKWVNKADMLLTGTLERHYGKTRIDSPAVKQIKDAFATLKELSRKDNLTQSDVEQAIAMLEALPVTERVDATTVQAAINNLKGLAKSDQARRDKQRIDRLASKLDTVLKGELKRRKKPKIAPSEEVKDLTDALDMISELAESNEELTDAQLGDVLSRVSNIRQLYNQHFDTEGNVSREAIERAIANMREIRREMQIDSLNKRIAEAKKDLRNLSDPDNIDINSLITDNTNIPWKPVEAEILKKEMELQELKNTIQDDIRKLRRKKIAENGINVLGYKFKGGAAQSLVNFYLTLKDLGWELPRTLAFMFDASAFGVQLAPVVVQELASPVSNFYKRVIMGREDVQVFQGWRRLASIFRDGFWNVVKSDINAIDGTFSDLKKSKGDWTRIKFQEMVNHPLYDLMKRSGLKISQTKSLTDSEEFYRSSLVNKVPILGWLKDVSEDTMVTTLNLYRVQLFEQFYKANPVGVTNAEYVRVAEHINNLTGTTRDFGAITNTAAWFMSAPRLFISRAKLALRLAAGANIHQLDIPKTLKEGGITKGVKFKNPAEAFVFNHLSGMGAAYAAWFAGIALLSVSFDSIDFGEDWEESDFLRVTVGPTSFDFTGGMGAIYRTIAQAIYLTQGPSEDASSMNKERINFLRAVKKQDALDVGLRFFKYKLHPTISRGKSVLTGRDFLGQPYSLFGSTEGLNPHVAAGIRAISPIFVETTIEQYFETPKTGFITDSAVNLAQFFGINTFEYDDLSQHVKVKDYFNDIEYRPSLRYPERLSGKEESTTKDYLKIKYREMHGDALGELILSHDADEERLSEKSLKFKWKSQRKRIEREFVDLYKDEIDGLVDKPKKKKASKPRSSGRRASRSGRGSRK